MTFGQPSQSAEEIAEKALGFLERVIAIESSSDENSSTIPSTPGQAKLAADLGSFFEGLGGKIETDDYANVIASFPGRGAGKDKAPIAMLIHLDTARGTMPIEKVTLHKGWQGERLSYSANDRLEVTLENYPALEDYLGQDLLHGPGDAPFGLDDKLGLTHMMSLAWLLHTNTEIDHPPLMLIGRPDEEIGRMEALEGLADLLAERGVRSGYTIDGLKPFEINIANFNASQASVFFESGDVEAFGEQVCFSLGGVNTHGATAKAEGHRAATRFGAEIVELLASKGMSVDRVRPVYFMSDELRDCDAVIAFQVADDDAREALLGAVEEVVGPHVPRGASFGHLMPLVPFEANAAVLDILHFVRDFIRSEPGFTLLAEDSEDWDGYSQPYRVLMSGDDLRLDVRIRDFDAEMLPKREAHVAEIATGRTLKVTQQYINMGTRLSERPELVEWAVEAGKISGVEAQSLPIRGGTGVDPFLERDIAVANLGTGYFAPESEKEFTSMQVLSAHALWLTNLVQVIAKA